MDTVDVTHDERFLSTMHKIQASTAEAKRKQGQLVQEHPPAASLLKTFVHNLIDKSYAASIAPGSGGIPVTLVPEPYPPCVVPAHELEPMSIAQMRLETHHCGKKVLLHMMTPPDRINAVIAIAEDEEETAILLQIYQLPEEKVISAGDIVPPHGVCIIKEPFFKQSVDGPYSVRVDHPGDIIWLSQGDERIPEKWRCHKNKPLKSSQGYREQGNTFVLEQDWATAFRFYSWAIEAAQTPEEERLAYLNRSLACLKLGWSTEALQDATRSWDPDAPTEKPLFRQALALYDLGEYEQCNKKLQTLRELFPDNQAAVQELERVRERLHEQKTGKYSFTKMYEQTEATPPLIDCATFSAPVEIRKSPGRGNGLFTTKKVLAGELLLCEKAFAYYFIQPDESGLNVNVLMNLDTQRMTVGGSAYLLPQIAQKLYHNPRFISAFQELSHESHEILDVTECDGSPVVDSFLVEKIISLNAFGSPRTTREFFHDTIAVSKQEIRDRVEITNMKDTIFTTSGIWLLAARVNHSCAGNCRRSFIGDMQIIRATEDMPAGTELLFFYGPPNALESYKEVQERLEPWGFSCDCVMCKDRSKTSPATLTRQIGHYKDLMNLIRAPGAFDVAKVNRCLRGVEKCYHGKPAKKVRLELAEACSAMGSRYRVDGKPAESGRMVIKSLEALGFVVVASLPGDSRPRLEVKHWGMAEHYTPWLFLQLAYTYNGNSPGLYLKARYYAEVAFSMIVGELETIWDVFTE